MTGLNEVIQSFIDTLVTAGIPPQRPSEIVGDGQLHRFQVEGDKSGTKNGYYVLHLGRAPAGFYGSWRLGIGHKWRADNQKSLTPADREAVRQEVKATQDRERQALIARQMSAARQAQVNLRDSRPADPRHPYLKAKGIPPLRSRQQGPNLVLPIVDLQSRELMSLQFIRPDGVKRFLTGGRKSGGVIPVAGRTSGAERVLITEGWATGASLAVMEPDALVLAALDAGNLHPVATAARKRWPSVELIIAADADRVGVEKARAAAVAARALIAVPQFPEGIAGSDWND